MHHRIGTAFGRSTALLLSALLCTLCALKADAGRVVTRTGTTHEGDVRLETGEVVVSTADKGPTRLPLAEVKVLDIDPPAKPAPTPPPGAGLLGEYFADRALKRRLFLRADPRIDLDWVESRPHDWLPREFSARWTGTLTPKEPGPYTFLVRANGAVRLWVGGKPVIDRWRDRVSGGVASEKIDLVAGQPTPVRLEWAGSRGGARVQLLWERGGKGREVVPDDRLQPAAIPATESDAATTRLTVRMPAADGGGQLTRLVEAAAGRGLLGEYFADKEMEKPVFRRTDPQVDFTYMKEEVDPVLGGTFAARWSGTLTPAEAGLYTFHITAEDGHRFSFDDRLLSDKWFHQATGFDTNIRVELEAGKSYPIRLDYYQGDGKGAARLEWTREGKSREVVPAACLSPGQEGPSGAGPVALLVEPAEGTVMVAPERATLRAAVGGNVKAVRYYADRELVAEATAPPFEAEWKKPGVGDRVLGAVAIDDKGFAFATDPVHVTVAGNGEGTFPPGWAEHVLGKKDDAPAGKATYAAGAFTLTASGGNLVYHDEDACRLLYQRLRGDGELIARVTKLEPEANAAGTLAGLMMRESFDPQARQVSLFYTLENVILSKRHRRGGSATSSDRASTFPVWLRLLRAGNVVRVYSSEDGKAWKLLGTERLDWPDEVLVGLTASTRDRDDRSTVTFDHVQLQRGRVPVAWETEGVVTTAGSFLAGDIQGIRDDKLRLSRNGTVITLPMRQVARLAYQRVLGETVTQLPPGQTGALLVNDDFLEGAVRSLSSSRVELDSLIFGRRNVPLNQDLAGILLQNVTPRDPAWIVETFDGSRYLSTQLRADGPELVADDAALGEVRIPQTQVRRLTAVK